jgi:hypothetical protein
MDHRHPLARAKSAYTAAARWAERVLTRAGVLPREPPDRAHRLRHWAASLARIRNSLALAELDVPWWTYDAIDEVDAWLARRRHPIRVFEYGSGASTIWLAKRADEVWSVEHDAAFAAVLAEALAPYPHVHLTVVEALPSPRPAVTSAKEGHKGLDFADYVAAIDEVEGGFDLVSIDGRARADCLRRAVERLAPDGMIVFDNSRRRRYRRAIEESGLAERRCRGLTPTLPYPEQTSLLTSRR